MLHILAHLLSENYFVQIFYVRLKHFRNDFYTNHIVSDNQKIWNCSAQHKLNKQKLLFYWSQPIYLDL